MNLEQRIAIAFDDSSMSADERRTVFKDLRDALERGEMRAAEPHGEGWRVNHTVKKGILLGFRVGTLAAKGEGPGGRYFDKDTMAARSFGADDGVRMVPGGSAVRRGAYVAPGVTLMPPAYVNIGAYVDSGTMIDSHALVGSCAQVGKRVHVSAAAQIGGVLEPIGALPVIIEDDVMIGGNCGVYEGVIVRKGAVLATGTIINASVPVYDIVHRRVIRADRHQPLEIPPGAVVVPGTRALSGEFGQSAGLAVQTAIIIKYRDAKTAGRVSLESDLRGAGDVGQSR